jgi:hypothetical protein
MTRDRRLSRVRDAVDRGADSAEEIHRKVADLPLRMLESMELLEDAVKEVRRVSERSIGALYGFVRDVNHEVIRLADDLLAEPRAASARRPARKRARAVRRAA